MADTITQTSAEVIAASAASTITNFSAFGYTFNFMILALGAVVIFGAYFIYKIQTSDLLNFADMITKDGRSVSLTKVLQLVGGVTATWIMIKLTLTGGLTEALFGLYLTYVGAIEGYSKYVAAKYNYTETSVKDATESKTEQ